MIIGIGNDLVDARRIEAVLEKHGQRFVDRSFSEYEAAYALRRKFEGGRAAYFAKRFAAKEAFVKALGTGFADGIIMKDISVEHDHNGRPVLKLSGAAQEYLNRILPEGYQKAAVHLSLSDELPYAQAFVVIEAC